MSADDHNAAGVTTAKPRQNIDDVHLRPLWMASHFDHRGVELDAQAPAAFVAVSVQPLE